MPVLNWIGKDAVVRHDAEVPFRLLHDMPQLSCPPLPPAGEGRDEGGTLAKTCDNLIVEGDNLLALKALLPYNTGQDERDNAGNRTGWVCSDNVDSPKMREWLNKVVGDEAEDLCRHDKWPCMMYPRLELLKRFLREDGVIFASIDDIELASLRMLFDEIFGAGNRVGTIVWKFVTLKRHLFSQIGNFKPDGEEFDCAQFIANEMDGVCDWIRNVERKPSSFSLPTSSDRFYPDFLIRMANGGIIATEYKGAHLATAKDSEEKKRIGAFWERRSGGRCAFAWMENNEWISLTDAARRCAGQQGCA